MDKISKMTKFTTAEKELKERGIEWNSPILENCPEWLKKAYLKDINYCEHINCKNNNLEIHRIKRGWEGGKYSPDNVKIACGTKHHPYYHSNEFPNCKSK